MKKFKTVAPDINCYDLKKMIYLASLIGIGASLLAVALSRHLLSVYELSLSTAGLVTLLLGMFFRCPDYKPIRSCFS